MPDGRQGRELIICVLNETDYLHEVLMGFVEAGVTTSTVIESQGMGRILSEDVPIFAGFRHLFAGSKPFNNTIFAVVDNHRVTERVIQLVRDVLADVDSQAKGVIFSVPVLDFASLSLDRK